MSKPDGMFDEALLLFFDESREMLQQMESALLTLKAGQGDIETIHAMFRCAHTIKGTSGIFNMDRVVKFTHQVESVLDRVRKGKLATDPELCEVLFSSCDMIAALLDQTEQHCQDQGALAACDAAAELLTQRLSHFLGHVVTAQATPAPAEDAGHGAEAVWHISLRFHEDTFRNGFDPLSIVQYLKTLGQIVGLAVVEECLPDWDSFDPESCSLGFEIRLRTEATKLEIESAFEFIGDDCTARIIPPTRRAADYIALMAQLPDEQRLGDILVGCGALTREALDTALTQQQSDPDANNGHPSKALGEILVEQKKVTPEVLDAALDRQAKPAAMRQETGLFVRVPADKLDELINVVGELVICGASASLQAEGLQHSGLIATTQLLSRLVEEVRDGALALRMVRIGETFVRYRRVVHDLSMELGKSVKLEIEGGDTELDKSVVEKIGDPLMHLVRNSLDHGIEMPATRLAMGKPAEGTITLTAKHDSGNIVIQIGDDGRGLDPEMLLAKAREKGLVGAGQVLTESEKLDLIFAPGFSTAEKVTNLSGRGVGMDVVRRNIEALRGSVSLNSVVGRGTQIDIRLPLTLAIIDGFLVKVGRGFYVIPLYSVIECIDTDATELRLNEKFAGYLNLRDQVLPLLDLRAVFAEQGPCMSKRRIVVVQGAAGASAGLLVDRLEGEYQTVIKPLGKLFQNLRGISGSTVLGSGEVALILDVAALTKLATQNVTRESGLGHQREAKLTS
jgi:two-component system chemotaxis sensor kinase CheA